MRSFSTILGLSCLLVATACDSDKPIPFNPSSDGGGGYVYPEAGYRGDSTICGNISRIPELPPFDILLALDTSYSMDFKEKWASIKAALKVFAGDASFGSLGVGVQYFPLRAQCKADEYAKPAITMTMLPELGNKLETSLDAQRMFGGTPMVPLLTGTLTYARKYASEHPERNVSIILATDGIPDNTCLAGTAGANPNTLDNAVALAASSAAPPLDSNKQPLYPRIPIFVIGVGSELTALQQIAAAGGTDKAFLVDTAANIQQAFLKALNDIRRTMACEYEMPPPPGAETQLALDAVTMQFSRKDKSGAILERDVFVNVGGASGCAGDPEKGWYYDDPVKPRKIVLCERACIKSHSEGGQIDVVFGCRPTPN